MIYTCWGKGGLDRGGRYWDEAGEKLLTECGGGVGEGVQGWGVGWLVIGVRQSKCELMDV